MAARKKSDQAWFETFDLEGEVEQLLDHIQHHTEFTIPAGKRETAHRYAADKLNDIRAWASDPEQKARLRSTSRRDFLETLQDAIFLAIPKDKIALMPLSEYVLNDPSFYRDAMLRAASWTEDEMFLAISPSLNDMPVKEARAFVSKLWHSAIDDNARKYAEALKRPERETIPLRAIQRR